MSNICEWDKILHRFLAQTLNITVPFFYKFVNWINIKNFAFAVIITLSRSLYNFEKYFSYNMTIGKSQPIGMVRSKTNKGFTPVFLF